MHVNTYSAQARELLWRENSLYIHSLVMLLDILVDGVL